MQGNDEYTCCDRKVNQRCVRNSYSCLCPISLILSIVISSLSAANVLIFYKGMQPFLPSLYNLISPITIDVQRVEGDNSNCSKLSLPNKNFQMRWEPIASWHVYGYVSECICGDQYKVLEQSMDCPYCIQVSKGSNGQYLSTWGSFDAPYSLCKLVYGEKNVNSASFANSLVKKGGKCANADKGYNFVCNSGASQDKQFCMPNESLCPIYEIATKYIQNSQIGQSSYSNFNGQPTAFGYSPINSNLQQGSQYFYNKQSNTNPPIADFRIVYGEAVCDNDEDISKNTYCQTSKQNWYQNLDQINASTFFKNNQATTIFPSLSLSKTVVPDDVVTLAYRPYIYWSMDCRDDYYEEFWDSILKLISALTINGLLSGVSSVAILITVLGGLGLLCQHCKTQDKDPYQFSCDRCTGCGCYLCKCFKRGCKKKYAEQHCCDYVQLIDPMVFSIGLIHFLIIFVQFIVGLVAAGISFPIDGAISQLASQNCSTSQINKTITDFSSNLKPVKSICGIIIVLVFIHIILVGCSYYFTLVPIVKQRRDVFQKIQERNIPNNSFQTIRQDMFEQAQTQQVLPYNPNMGGPVYEGIQVNNAPVYGQPYFPPNFYSGVPINSPSAAAGQNYQGFQPQPFANPAPIYNNNANLYPPQNLNNYQPYSPQNPYPQNGYPPQQMYYQQGQTNRYN